MLALSLFLYFSAQALAQPLSNVTDQVATDGISNSTSLTAPGTTATVCWPNTVAARYPRFPDDCAEAARHLLAPFAPNSQIRIGFDQEMRGRPGYFVAGSYFFLATCRVKLATVRQSLPDPQFRKLDLENLAAQTIIQCGDPLQEGVTLLETPNNLIFWTIELNRSYRPSEGKEANGNGTATGNEGQGIKGFGIDDGRGLPVGGGTFS